MQGDVLVDKENVGPRGSAAWSQQAMLHSKNRGLGGAGHDAVRKEKAGVLTSNSTTNNGGGAAGLGSLELLKERVKLLKLSSANGASQDSGARLLKHRSPLVDIKFTEGTVKSTMGGNFSKEGTVYSTADERSSCLSQEVPSFSRPSQHRAVSSERSERILRSNNLHSSGGNIGSKSLWPGKGKGLDMYHESRDRREASRSRVEAWVSGVGQSAEDVVSTSPLRPVSEQHVKASRSFGITLQQTEGEKQVPQSSSNSRDSGGWSGSRRQGTPYKRRLPLLEEEKVGKTSTEDEAERNNNQRHGADDASPLAEVPKHSSQYRQVEYPEVHADKSEDGVKTLDERAVKHLGSQSVDRISDRRTLEMSGRGLSSPGGIRSASIVERSVRVLSEKKVTCSDSSKLTRSSGVWDSGTGWSRQEVVYEKEVSRSTSSYYNVDTTAAAPSVLLSRMTGASSSGSSATPGLSGSSSRDDDTVGCPESSKPTPSSKEHAIPSSRERLVSRTRISKRLKALGPASRVLLSGALRVTVEDDDSGGPKDGRSPSNIMVSPDIQSSASLKGSPSGLNGHSPITPEEAQKSDNAGQVEYDLLLDLKKRKAENDPSIGDISQGDNQSSTGSKSPLGTDAQAILQSASDLLRDVHNNHLRGFNNMLPTCRHSSLKNLEGLGDNVLPTLRRVEQTTSGVEPHLSQISSRRTTRPDSSSDLQPDSKTVLEKVNINKASLPASKQSRGTPGKPHSGLGSPKDLANFDNRQVVEREVAQVKASVDTADRSPGNSSISKSHMTGKQSPSSEVLRRSMEIEGSRILSKRGTSDAKEGSEAVSMSHDALFSKDRSETRPGSIQDLSGSLGSLSIGEKNVLSKSQSRGPLQNVLNASCSNPTVAPVNQSNTKNLEAIGVLPNTSHSGKSAVTSENEPISQGPRSLPFDSSRRGEYGASKDRHANEQKSEASLRPASSGRPEVAASGAHQSGDEVPRENGNGATAAVTQRRVSENAHFFWVNDKRYQKLGKIGKGGSSEVYKVIDSECSIYALKKISLKGRDHASALGFYQEIEYLERLRGKRHIVQLIDYEVTNRFVIDDDYEEEKISEDACIYMVLEFGEIDLAGILSKKRKEMLDTNEPLDDNWLRFYWKHMLLAVKTIHDERIVHADLKPANFLLVKGELKLIDFGIAKAIQNDTTHIVRDAQVGTLNYMSPEAFMTNSKDEEGQVVKCGRSSDIWSLGCILYQMVYGHTPFSQVDSFYAKIQAITSRSYTIDYPPVQDPWLLDVMKKCLTWSRNSRPDIAQLLVHPFLRPDLAQQRYVK